MKIKLDSKYLSLNPFQSEELPNFTVIVGKNGSGKSQLVQLFYELMNAKTSMRKPSHGFNVIPEIARCYPGSLIIEDVNIGNPVDYRNEHIAIHTKYKEYMAINAFKKAFLNIYLNRTKLMEIEKLQIKNGDDISDLKKMLSFDSSIFTERDIDYLDNRPDHLKAGNPATLVNYNKFLVELKNSLNTIGAAMEVAEYQKKGILVLEENDFLNSNISDKYIERRDLIESKIEAIFYNYLRKRHKNELDFFRKEKYGDANSSVGREIFDSQYLNPIKEVNEILTSLGLNYYFKEISEKDFSSESNIQFDFYKKGTETKIRFNNLSSGEKIIMALIIRLFTSDFYKEDLKFPDLIILDEPDAHLHPEMSNILIKALNETFVKKIGIKVIITTHSPMTVALTPEESIFQLNNHPETFLKKISKDDALKNLTNGLPSLTIDYENHRQIFVESPTDLFYFQTLFEKYCNQKPIKHKLYFISNGYGKGNCDQVLKVVKDLRNGGNKTCFGVIDWDKKNPHGKDVFVHGFQKRYSIENFVFDPLYLAILLIEQNYTELKTEIGYSDSDNQYELIKTDKAQKAIDFIIAKLVPRNSQRISFESALQKHKYGDYTFDIPTWYLNIQGHDLKQQILDQFKPLEGIKNSGEHEIEKRLTKIIGKLYPNVPFETIELFEKLST